MRTARRCARTGGLGRARTAPSPPPPCGRETGRGGGGEERKEWWDPRFGAGNGGPLAMEAWMGNLEGYVKWRSI
jgi:hypothetical protein